MTVFFSDGASFKIAKFFTRIIYFNENNSASHKSMVRNKIFRIQNRLTRILPWGPTMCNCDKDNVTSKMISEQFFKIKFVAMSKPRLLLLSSSSVHGHGYLEYAATDINIFLNKCNVSTILFVPYASVDHNSYYEKVKAVFNKWDYHVESIHKHDPVDAVLKAEAIFIGGGNTFLLLKTLYANNLINPIRERVLNDGIPYIGSSAGTNVAAPTIHNTNDMPIVYPPSFCGLNLIPFNINPHYLDPDTNSTHKGETREERILQYHSLPSCYDVYNVLGLREGCTLFVDGQVAVLKGINNARLFIRGKPPKEIEVGTDLSYLFTEPFKSGKQQTCQF